MKLRTDSFKTFHAQTKVFLRSSHTKTRAFAILELGAMAEETGAQLEFTGHPIRQHRGYQDLPRLTKVNSDLACKEGVFCFAIDLDFRLIES